jgi:hypothetical protein
MAFCIANAGFWPKADIALVLRSEDRIDHPPDSVSCCSELIAVAVSQIDGDPIVGDRLVDPALEITVAHFKKIIASQRAGRRNPMTHENAEDLTANVLVGRSVRHRSTIRLARHCSYGRTATVDNIAQPRSNLAFAVCPLSGVKRTWAVALQMSTNDPKRTFPPANQKSSRPLQIGSLPALTIWNCCPDLFA